MNRSNYDTKTISTFEIIGAFFVDVFYNRLFLTARRNHLHGKTAAASNSLTDEYKNTLASYLAGLKQHQYYEKTVKDLNEYYRDCTKFKTIGLSDFIDKILEQYLPHEHFSVLVNKDKYFFLNSIIVSCVESFVNKTIEPDMMMMIIDDHTNVENTRKWIDVIVDIQIIERERMYNRFVKKLRGNDAAEQLDISIVKKIQEDRDMLYERCQAAIKEKHIIAAEMKKAKRVVEVLFTRFTAMVEQNKTLVEQNNGLIEQNNALLEKNSMLSNKNDMLVRGTTAYTPAPAPPPQKYEFNSSPQIETSPRVEAPPVVETSPVVEKSSSASMNIFDDVVEPEDSQHDESQHEDSQNDEPQNDEPQWDDSDEREESQNDELQHDEPQWDEIDVELPKRQSRRRKKNNTFDALKTPGFSALEAQINATEESVDNSVSDDHAYMRDLDELGL